MFERCGRLHCKARAVPDQCDAKGLRAAPLSEQGIRTVDSTDRVQQSTVRLKWCLLQIASAGQRYASVTRVDAQDKTLYPWALPNAGISSCLRKLGAASAAQEWEAAAPAPPPHPTAGGIDSASATAASRAACDHVNRGLAVLEQRAAAIVSVQGTMVGRAPPASGPLSAAARSSGSFSRPASAAPPAAAQAAGSASSAAPPHLRPASGASTESQPQSLSQPQRQSYRESTASYDMADSRRPSSAQTGVSVLDAVAAAAGIMDRNYEVIVSDEEGEVRAVVQSARQTKACLPLGGCKGAGHLQLTGTCAM